MVKSWIQFMGCLRMAGSIITFLLLVEEFVFEAHPSRVPCHAHNGWPLLPLHARGPTWCSQEVVMFSAFHPTLTWVCSYKFQFDSLLSQVWYKSIKPETIVSGFKKTGVCPLNKSVVRIAQSCEDRPSSSEMEAMCSTSEKGQNNSMSWYSEAEHSEVTVNYKITEPNFTVE